MRVICIGGAGFIGSHVVESLIEHEHTVVVVDNLSTGLESNIHVKAGFVKEDIRNLSHISKTIDNADACVHLAAIASVPLCEQDPLMARIVNEIAPLTIAGLCISRGIPFYFASSAAIYGNVELHPENAIHETHSHNPAGIYGETKSLVDQKCCNEPGCLSFRFANVYGPRQLPTSQYSGVISRFIQGAMKGEITINGTGEQTRDFIYVKDVAEVIATALDNRLDRVIRCMHVSTQKPTSILKLAQTISEITQHKLGVIRPNIVFAPERSNDIKHSVLMNGIMCGSTLIQPTSLYDGLVQTICPRRSNV